MTWKKVNNADPGDATHHGGDSTDKISDAFSGTDVDDIDMNCDFTLRSGKGHLRNPANTFSYNLVGGAIAANRNINYPVLTADDTPTFNAFAQTLTNKTMELEDNTLKLRDHCRVLKDGSTYYAIKEDGSIVSSGSTAEIVIQAALDNATYTNLSPDTYTLSAGFSGFTIGTGSARKVLEGSVGTTITVPAGFTGSFLKFTDADHCRIRGFRVNEASTVSRLWTGILLQSDSSSGVTYNRIDNLGLVDCGVGIKLKTTTTSSAFVNGNKFRDVVMSSPVKGVVFENFSTDDFRHNVFDDIEMQGVAGITTDGFQDVQSRSNIFINPMTWDFDATANEMSIHANATDTIVIGGTVAAGGSSGIFTDNGAGTIVMGRGKSGEYINGRLEFKRITAPTSPAADHARLYVKQTDANNDDLYIKIKQSGSIVEKKVTLA